MLKNNLIENNFNTYQPNLLQNSTWGQYDNFLKFFPSFKNFLHFFPSFFKGLNICAWFLHAISIHSLSLIKFFFQSEKKKKYFPWPGIHKYNSTPFYCLNEIYSQCYHSCLHWSSQLVVLVRWWFHTPAHPQAWESSHYKVNKSRKEMLTIK